MDRIGVRQLRATVAAHVRRASAGERVIITVDGRPVAQLGPLEPEPGAQTLEDLAAQGRVILARRQDRPVPEFAMPLWAGTRIDQLAREVRGR